MYYLSKFCRICIQSGVKLLDIDTLDFDSVKLSEKLEMCTKMVVGRESLSTEICVQCISKLRISYQFHDMCRKSTKILQGYLKELIGASNKTDPDAFVSTELTVSLAPLTTKNLAQIQCKRKRITKEQRCSLLKQLLTSREKCRKERDKDEVSAGGLKSIINFTRNYEFGWNFDKKPEPTHLDKLTEFSNNFFRNDFSEFRDTILYIIENKDNLYETDESDDDLDFVKQETELEAEASGAGEDKIIKFEEVIVEPDIKIKRELDYEEGNDNDSDLSYNFVEASYEGDVDCKKENPEGFIDSMNQPFVPYSLPSNNNYKGCGFEYDQNTSVSLLDKLVASYSRGNRKTFSSSSVRCRTRNNPYINPTLREQFLFRSFRCDKCNRYFKSPGYLKAHNSKVHF